MSKFPFFTIVISIVLFSFSSKNSMVENWKKIERWIYKAQPLMIQSLNEGASNTQIQTLEKELQITLPTSYKDFIKIHNGQKFGSDAFMDLETLTSTTDIISVSKMLKELLDAGTFEPNGSTPDIGIKNNLWNPNWIPITSNGYGDHICIDLDPATGGTNGQIITMIHDDARRELLASSFEEWINQYVSDLEKGIYVYSVDYGGIIKASELED